MEMVSLKDAQLRLPEIISNLKPGEKICVTKDDRMVAEIQAPVLPKGVPIPGRAAGMLICYVEDDEHLQDFKEYMP